MDAIVVGAGPAGLAAAAALRRRGLDPVVLERGQALGTRWRTRYDGLRLNTFRAYSQLPACGCRARPGGARHATRSSPI